VNERTTARRRAVQQVQARIECSQHPANLPQRARRPRQRIEQEIRRLNDTHRYVEEERGEEEEEAQLTSTDRNNNIPCPLCSSQLATQSTLAQHINAIHKDVAEIQGYLRCNQCRKFCKGEKGLQQHHLRSQVCVPTSDPNIADVEDEDSNINGSSEIDQMHQPASGEEASNINDGENQELLRAAAVQHEQQQRPRTPIRGGQRVQGSTSSQGSARRRGGRTRTPPNSQQDPAADQDNEAFQEALRELLATHDTESLFTHFREKLYKAHHSWQKPIVDIIRKLIPKVMDNDINIAKTNTAALFLLPGMIQFAKRTKRGVVSPIDFLKAIRDNRDPGTYIFREATNWNREEDLRREEVVERHSGPQRTSGPEGLIRRIEKLVGENRLSLAAATLDELQMVITRGDEQGAPEQRYLSKEQTMAIIEKLHPPGTEADILPDEDMPTPVQIDESDILQFGKQCNEESAGGCSGWTFALIKAILNTGTMTQKQETAKDFTTLGNYVLSGSIPESLKDLWYDGRAALIPKPDGNYRTLGIGEALYRMFAGCAVKKVSKKAGEALLPFQLAVGVSGGVEIGARTAQLSFDYPGEVGPDGMAVASLDVTNAYNTQRRIDAYNGLKEYCPGLVKLFKSKYGRTNTIRNAKGEVVGHGYTGLSQGDPFATLCYTCGQQPLIRELQDVLHEESQKLADQEDANPEAHPYMMSAGFHRPLGSVKAEADDTTIYGRAAAVLAVCARAPDIFAKYGFTLAKQKSQIIGKMVPYLDEAKDPELDGFEILDTGCKILGRPVGTVEFQKDWLRNKLAKRVPPAEAARRISAKILYRLLYFCYNARPSYLAAVLDKEVSQEALAAFDQAMDSVLAEKLDIDPENEMFQTLRSLPWRLGGKGMRRHSGPRTEKAILISRARTCEYLQKYDADLYYQIRLHNELMWPAVQVGDSVGKTGDAVPQHVGVQIHTVEDAKTKATADLRKVEKAIYEDIRSSLTQNQQGLDQATVDANKEFAAWHLSSSVYGSGRWAIAPMFLMRRMSDNDFIENMRLSMLCRYQNGPGPYRRRCYCARGRNNASADQWWDLNGHPTHVITCTDFKNLATDSHNEVRDVIAKKLNQSYPDATVTTEHLMDGVVGNGELRADVCFILNRETRFIEISIANPSAAKYTDNTRNSSITKSGGAATAAESRRTLDYTSRIPGFQVQTLVPFIIESTGQLGPKAKLFIDTMFTDTNTRSALMTEISVIIAAFNGKMLHLARRRRPVL